MSGSIDAMEKISYENNKEFRHIYARDSVTSRIIDAMEKLHVTRAELAEKLGTSKSNVTQMLNGSRNLTIESISDIAFAVGAEMVFELKVPSDDDTTFQETTSITTSLSDGNVVSHTVIA